MHQQYQQYGTHSPVDGIPTQAPMGAPAQKVQGDATPEEVVFIKQEAAAKGWGEVLSVHRPNLEATSVKQFCMSPIALPCFWPCLPCAFAFYQMGAARNKYMLYFTTTNGLGQVCRKPGARPTEYSQWQSSPWQNAYNSWKDVEDVSSAPAGCQGAERVLITLPGYRPRGGGDQQMWDRNRQTWFVKDVQGVAQLVTREMARARTQAPATSSHAPPAAPAAIRVFVCHSTTPHDRRIATLNPAGTWDDALGVMAAALGQGLPSRVQLVPADGGAPIDVNSLYGLAPNDTLMVVM